MKRWDAKDKICQPTPAQPPVQEWGQLQPKMEEKKAQEPTLKKMEADGHKATLACSSTASNAALEKLLAERKKLDNYWSQ